MRKKVKKWSAILLTMLILFSSLTLSISALTFTVGGTLGSGTITSAYNRSVADGVTYSRAVFRDSSSDLQQVHALSFNPQTSNFVPLVYSKFSGYGATTYNSCVSAETKYGYDCVGGVNASFFSFVGTCCNTYGGVNISDGKVLQGCNSNGANYMLTFDSDGTSDLVYSKVAFSLSVNGSAWSNALQNINMFPYTTGTGIYYYDAFCGTSTDTNTAGVEIVFNKTNNTELTVGGTLTGTVAEIRSSVSDGGSIGANQFVLYASNASSYAASLRALSIGDTAEITATETISAAVEKMENCNSAFVTYGYHIVANGVNVTSSNGLGEEFNRASAQRSAVGIKSDGTLIIVATNGRTTSYPGLTVYELADMLIGLGCVTAVNLDGGGSTQMTVQNSSGTLVSEFSSTRRVANSLLIVQRPTIPTSMRNTLSSLVSSADTYLNNYVLSPTSTQEMTEAYNYGNGVYNASSSMKGDYTKAIMRLQEAIANVSIIGKSTGIYTSSSSLVMRSTASSGGSAVTTVPANTSLSITSISGDFGYTKYLTYTGYVDLTNATRISGLSNASAVISSVNERTSGANLEISWAGLPGAAGYTYKVIQLVGEPDPGNNNESVGATELAYVQNTRNTSVTIPSSSMTDGKYIKIAVAVIYPNSTAWSVKYVSSSELPFTDVATSSWYYDSVKYVYTAGLFSGTSSTTFSPDTSMTRGMMVTVLYRLAGSPTVSGTMPFTDIYTTDWYYNAVLWAYTNGIASGTSPTKFTPNENVTRQQAVVFLYRYAEFADCDMSITSGFSITGYNDYNNIASYAITAMTWAVDKGIISGNNNYLYPENNASRAEIACILKNFSEKMI
ncbi:MAG: S-layer homology domain-containing protein [Eubacteriales bacterium]|nr:S-layer homology domain-containing protein [Eubacteriales bacterium]